MGWTRLRYVFLVVTVAAVGIWTLAVGVPNTFSEGTTIRSSEVNENFQTLAAAITPFEEAIVVDGEANVGIGVGAPSQRLHVFGGILGVDPDRGIIGTQGTTSCAGSYAVGGCATTENGVYGRASGGIGVWGTSSERGVVGTQGSTSCTGTYGIGGCATSGDGVVGRSDTGRAGYFDGDVDVTGNLNVTGTKSFRIDHPLDPANMYLVHYSVESNEVLNVYSGRVRLDDLGRGEVRLPHYFEALNGDVRYQLTPIGAAMPRLHVAEPVEDNRFSIAGGSPDAEVSWEVTAVRDDPSVRISAGSVERLKPEPERGTFLDPEALDVRSQADAR